MIRTTTQRTAGIGTASLRRPLPRADRLADWGRAVAARGTRGTADLVLLSALLILTGAIGKPFSKLGAAGAHVFVTELAIVAIAAAAVWRCGVAGAVARVRSAIPIVPLLLLWLAGAIATVRGIHGYGLPDVTHDIGLVEYSVFLPLVAMAVDTPRKADALLGVLVAAGSASAAVYAVVFFFAPHSGIGFEANPASAVGLFIGVAILLVAARALHGLDDSRRLRLGVAAAVAAALVLLWLLVARSVVMGLGLAAVVLVVLAPRRRLAAAAVAAVALAASGLAALAIQSFGIGGLTTITALAQATVTGDGGYVADDGMSSFSGGSVVNGDAAAGRLSREIERVGPPPYFELTTLLGLRPHRPYTVTFWAKPVSPVVTSGRVGDTSGAGWGQRRWRIDGVPRWQRVSETLVATREAERVVVFVDIGSPRVRIDGIRVERGRRPSLVARRKPKPPAGGGVPVVTPVKPNERTGVVVALSDTFRGGETGTGFHTNQSWRLAIWRFQLERALRQPLLGVGFGTPTAFRWNGTLYDGRRGVANDPNDVTGPHNSFVDLAFRTGLLGTVSLAALLAIGLARTLGRLRRPLRAVDRAGVVGLLAAFVFAAVVASFNVALEGPYMSTFFWAIVGLLLVLPRRWRDRAPEAPEHRIGA